MLIVKLINFCVCDLLECVYENSLCEYFSKHAKGFSVYCVYGAARLSRSNMALDGHQLNRSICEFLPSYTIDCHTNASALRLIPQLI